MTQNIMNIKHLQHKHQSKHMNKKIKNTIKTTASKHGYFLREKTMKNVTNSTQMINNNSLHGTQNTCGLFDKNLNDKFNKMEPPNIHDFNMNTNESMYLLNDNIKNDQYIDYDNIIMIKNVNNKNSDSIEKNQIHQLLYNHQYNIDANSPITENELNFEKQVNINDFINNKTTIFNSMDVNQNIKSNCTKFSEKVKEQNFKIIMPPARQDSFNIPFNEDDLKLITPNTEKLCMEFLQSIPDTQELPLNDFNELNLLQTPQILNTPDNLTTNPFIAPLASNIKLNSIINVNKNEEIDRIDEQSFNKTKQTIKTVTLDHDYICSKRKLDNTCLIEETSRLSMDSINSQSTQNECFTSTTLSPSSSALNTPTNSKKRRTKGIYRANDVTNETELENYLERRRKNNLSSKQSRLTKKKIYNDMDEKAKQLANDNERLKITIQHLETLTKVIKDALLQQFSSTNVNV